MTILDKIGPLLKKAIPTGAALKGIAAADPKLRAFLFAATAAGYGADVTMDFLRDLYERKDEQDQRQNMEQRQAKGMARPDEKAALAERESGIPNALKKGVQVGAGLLAARGAGGGAAAVAPTVMASQQQPQPGQPPQTIDIPPEQIANQQPQLTDQSVPPQLEQQVPEAPPPVESPPEAPLEIDERSFFKRAMAGQEFFDLPDNQRARIGPIGKRLMTLERDGVKWETKNVQRLVGAIQKIINIEGLVEEETQRFEGQYGGEQPQQSNEARDQLSQLLDAFAKKYDPDA